MKTRYWILLWCFSLFYLDFHTLNHPCIFGMLNYVLRGNSSQVSHISVYLVSRGTDCSLFQSIFSRIEMVFPSRTEVRFAYSLEDIASPPWGKLQASLLSTITKIMSPFGVMGRCLLPIFKDPSFLSLGFLSCCNPLTVLPPTWAHITSSPWECGGRARGMDIPMGCAGCFLCSKILCLWPQSLIVLPHEAVAS